VRSKDEILAELKNWEGVNKFITKQLKKELMEVEKKVEAPKPKIKPVIVSKKKIKRKK